MQSKWGLVFRAWWRFFWRYAVFLILLWLAGGALLNILKTWLSHSQALLGAIIIYGLLSNMLAAAGVFCYILDRQWSRSNWILRVGDSPRAGVRTRLSVFWHYFWRFLLLIIPITFLLAVVAVALTAVLGYDPVIMLRHSRILSCLAIPLSSLVAFMLLMLRTGKRQKMIMVEMTPYSRKQPLLQ